MSITEIRTSTPEGSRLVQLVHVKRRNRVSFFNTPDGVAIRLQLQPHLLRQNNTNKHCELCGSGTAQSRSKFMCGTCQVHLSTRTLRSNRNSCWAKWHETKLLEEIKSKTDAVDLES